MPPGWSFTNINLAEIPVFVGALLGAMLVFLFSSLAIKAVGRTAQKVVQDVRDQFRENPGIMEGTAKPDYARCVDIVTGAALKEMVLPGLLVVGLPVAVGLIFRNFSSTFGTSSRCAGQCSDHQRPSGQPRRSHRRRRPADGRHHRRHPAGHADEQRRRRLGQRQEVHRDRTATAASAPRPTRPPSSATPSAIPSRTPPGPSLHVLIKLLATITLVLAPLFL